MQYPVVQWLLRNGLHILLILAMAFAFARALSLALRRFESFVHADTGTSRDERLKRARTLSRLVSNVFKTMIFAVAALMILRELDLDITPLLASAGILGLAVGFGAQTLVKDVISGFFLILEDHIRVGDFVEINGVGGLVEMIHLRTIVLRDVRGAVHVFPCGSVTTLANLTKDYAYAVLDFRVHYRHDVDKVIDLMRTTAIELSKDPQFGKSLIEPLEVLGVEGLADAGITIRARVKTTPLSQWDVAREMRRRIKKAFDAAGIEMSAAAPR